MLSPTPLGFVVDERVLQEKPDRPRHAAACSTSLLNVDGTCAVPPESRATRAEMMLEEKGREMEGRVVLVVMVQDERREDREDVESANRRQLVNMTWPSTDMSLRSLSSLAQLSIAAVSKE